MIGIYHKRDLDGWCSAAIMLRKFPDINLIGWDYGDPVPDIATGEAVIMADISFPIADMIILSERCALIWIDHHSSAIKDYTDLVSRGSRPAYRAIIPWAGEKKAACQLVWEYMYPSVALPRAVALLGDYDAWNDHGDKDYWDRNVMPFQLAMRLRVCSPQAFPQELLSAPYSAVADTEIDSIKSEGQVILRYQSEMDRQSCADCIFVRRFKGYNFLCLNTSQRGSPQMKSVYNPVMHDGMLIFRYTPANNFWSCSVYSTNDAVDCGAIAKSLGGGGHRGAAGFRASTDDIMQLIDGDPDTMKGIYTGS